MRPTNFPTPRALCAALLAAGLAACGGGDDDPPTTTISGNVVKGPVVGAQVCAYRATSAGKGEQLKCVTSGVAGAYSMDLQLEGEVVIEASGGSYTDEASGSTRTLDVPMQVLVKAQGGNTFGVVTPLTSIAYNLAKAGGGGLNSTTFSTAIGNVGSRFQLGTINIVTTVPVVSGNLNEYGRILRAVSQFIADGQSLAAFQRWANPAAFQAAFSAAYAAINGQGIDFNFGSAPEAGDPDETGGTEPGTGDTGGSTDPGTGSGDTGGGTAPAPGGDPGDGSTEPAPGGDTGGAGPGAGGTVEPGLGGGGAGYRNLLVTVTVMGTSTAIDIGSVPAPGSQAEFCADLQNDTTFTSIAGQGGTLTINSCSFSGNVGNVQATLSITSPMTMTMPYSIRYEYR